MYVYIHLLETPLYVDAHEEIIPNFYLFVEL